MRINYFKTKYGSIYFRNYPNLKFLLQDPISTSKLKILESLDVLLRYISSDQIKSILEIMNLNFSRKVDA